MFEGIPVDPMLSLDSGNMFVRTLPAAAWFRCKVATGTVFGPRQSVGQALNGREKCLKAGAESVPDTQAAPINKK